MVSQSASSQSEKPPKPPQKTNLERLEKAIREIAEKRQRLPKICVLSDQIGFPRTQIYDFLKKGVERGIWDVVRPHAGFLQIIGRGWQTLSYDEWKHNREEYKRKCLRCRVGFSTMHRYRFMCDPCVSAI